MEADGLPVKAVGRKGKNMKKYVIRLGGYVRDVFIVPENNSEGTVLAAEVELKKAAMTFRKKYLADAIAKALGGDVEELK